MLVLPEVRRWRGRGRGINAAEVHFFASRGLILSGDFVIFVGMEEEVEYIDLYRLQTAVRQGMAQLFPDAVWVKAEIASISRRPNGHCYLELAQSEDSKVIAQVRAVIWKNTFPFLSTYFKKVTGNDLASGQEVLVHVKVGYHEIYGMSLTIDDINPEFTLGAREALRKKTIERLESEGLMLAQKELCLTDLPYYLAVISAPDAAGYGDFRRHLLENSAGYAYHVDLFEALMQGQGAPASICQAIADIEASKVPYDAVLILRGGGSDLDLDCFDDYSLAAAIARCPVPVFTAIGHDRDYHIADMVANRFVKTPTALADLFLECTAAEDERISALESALSVAFATRLKGLEAALESREIGIMNKVVRRLDASEAALNRFSEVVSRGASARCMQEESRLNRIDEMASRGAMARCLKEQDRLEALDNMVGRVAATRIRTVEGRLAERADYIRKMALNTLERAEIRLASLDMRIASADPRKVLERGIPVVENSRGRKDAGAADYAPGDPVKVFLRDGKLDCIVQRVTLAEPPAAVRSA